MNTCPKCGSKNVVAAPDEAPAWAKQWVKCFACGKRWDLAGAARSAGEDDEDGARIDATKPPPRSAEDLVARIMQVARGAPAEQKKEMTMARCTKKNCPDEAAADSVRCPKHRDMQRAANAKFNGRAAPDAAAPKRKYTKRIPLGGSGGTVSTARSIMPATRTAPITMAEPTIVNGNQGRRMDIDGEEVSVLDSFIGKLEVDLQILHAAKEVMERHG